MFPSSSENGVLPSYCSEYLLEDACLSSTTNPFTPFFHFSPTVDHVDPFLHHETDLLGSHFQHSTAFSPNATTSAAAGGVINMVDPAKVAAEGMSGTSASRNFLFKNNSPSLGVRRKRGTKKDRHSKICTAQGPRDRRMRLSIEIARSFFNLQDMLGFDKASKTVGWLLKKSRAAIQELSRATSRTKGCNSGGGKSICSPSEGEVVSGIDEIADNVDSKEKSAAAIPKSKKTRNSRRTAPLPLAREWRAMARARARERTREKMLSRSGISKIWSDENPHDSTSFSALETREDSASHGSNEKKSPFELVAEVVKPSAHALDYYGSIHHIANKSLPKTCNLGHVIFDHMSSPLVVNSNDFVSFQNNDMTTIFQENWDIGSTRTHSGYNGTVKVRSSTSNAEEQVTNPLLEMSVGSRLLSQFTSV